MRRLALAFWFLVAGVSQSFAAIPATSVFEVQTGGNDLNAGAFDSATGGIDRSDTETSPYVTIDGATITATVHSTTTQVTITGYTVDDGDDTGNFVRWGSGSSLTQGLYKIESADEANNRWVLDRSAGTAGQTGVGRMGGCLATPGRAAADATVSGNKIWVRTGTYTITTATPGTAGPVQFANNIAVSMEGYSATRGDRAATPTLNAGAQSTLTLFACQGTGSRMQRIVSMKADGNSQSTIVGFAPTSGQGDVIYLCVAANCTSSGFSGNGANTPFLRCFADTCAIGFDRASTRFCVAKSCTTVGFRCQGARVIGHSIAYLCADGFDTNTGTVAHFLNCIADQCTGNGFNFGSNPGFAFNCLATNQSGAGDKGFTTSASPASVMLINCAIYGNNTGFDGTYLENSGSITLSGDPYIDQAASDFRPNRRAAGLQLMNAAIGVYGQTNYKAVGALDFSPYMGTR